MKKNKYFPYGYFSKQTVGYCPRTRQPVYEYRHTLPKEKTMLTRFSKVLILFLFLLIAMALMSCSNKPIVDSRGKSSANIEGDMNRYHDDYYTCQNLVKDSTNVILDKGKVVYNGFRWRILWLSPKLQTRQDYINNCLEGRGYNVLNKH
tara:strand:- start:155 stop:601 length:447 start_codon:yes stop_codon:yes gene_type:complete